MIFPEPTTFVVLVVDTPVDISMKYIPEQIKTITLTPNEYRSAYRVDEDIFRSECQRSKVLDEIDRRTTYELRRVVYGIDHPPKHFVRYPCSWYEAFKLRFFPQWLIEKYPIKYNHVEVSLKETYPDFKPAVRDYQTVVQLYVTEKYSK